jgi:hypothetical protein
MLISSSLEHPTAANEIKAARDEIERAKEQSNGGTMNVSLNCINLYANLRFFY